MGYSIYCYFQFFINEPYVVRQLVVHAFSKRLRYIKENQKKKVSAKLFFCETEFCMCFYGMIKKVVCCF